MPVRLAPRNRAAAVLPTGLVSTTQPSARDRLIVALDVPSQAEALALAGTLAGHVGMLKIGLELFVAEGPTVVSRIREAHPTLGIFLDLKLHDIPNTMRGAIRSARALGVRLLTVHAGSGVEHLRACVEEAGDALGILAVTVLTSQDAQACAEAGHTRSPAELVVLRAAAARRAGCAGIVCSGQELRGVVEAAPRLLRVVPGIRPVGADAGDQKRVMTPAQAIADGATHLVVGRPIVHATDPAAAADAIVAEIAGAR
jgi:orotidine-5'-phosphate decarboxylase